MRIIAFNGPPRSGKDTAANLMADYIRSRSDRIVHRRALSMPLRLMAFGALQREYSMSEFETIKDEVIPALGVTFRRFMIDISERLMKPVYRSDIFPLLMLSSIPADDRPRDPIVIVSDMGFQIESSSLSLHAGAENVAVVHVKREGYTFANDSRSYVSHIQSRLFEIDNNGDLETLNQSVTTLAETLNGFWDI